jgi:hypothetical protein
MGTNFNFGWFTQYFYSRTTIRETFCLLLSIITLCPIRFERRTELPIHCLQKLPTDYFEKKFNAVELFMEILKDEKNWKQSLGSIMLIWLQVFNLLKTIVNNGLTECKPNLVINSRSITERLWNPK